jgi:hypothetical protein
MRFNYNVSTSMPAQTQASSKFQPEALGHWLSENKLTLLFYQR